MCAVGVVCVYWVCTVSSLCTVCILRVHRRFTLGVMGETLLSLHILLWVFTSQLYQVIIPIPYSSPWEDFSVWIY